MVVSDCKHAFKVFERIQHSREVTVTIISRIIPSDWSVLSKAMTPKTQTSQNPVSQRKGV